MHNVYALRRRLPQLWLGACTIATSLFLNLGCKSCGLQQQNKTKQNTDEQSSCVEPYVPAAELHRIIKMRCKTSKEAPIMQAFYIDQSIPRELFLHDILTSDSKLNQCAPGPFLFSNDNEIDTESKRWQLPATPNYFVLQLDESKGDENFYIANQNGFPLKCQSFKLKQQDITTLVLVPKSKLDVAKSYYLYLIQKNSESRLVWIQPLVIMAEKN